MILKDIVSGTIISSIYFLRKDKAYKKTVEQKLKYLEDNPLPLSGNDYQKRIN